MTSNSFFYSVVLTLSYLYKCNISINPLFLKSHILKLIDLVTFKTAQIMFNARNNLLPGNLQKMYIERQGGYNLSEELNF